MLSGQGRRTALRDVKERSEGQGTALLRIPVNALLVSCGPHANVEEKRGFFYIEEEILCLHFSDCLSGSQSSKVLLITIRKWVGIIAKCTSWLMTEYETHRLPRTADAAPNGYSQTVVLLLVNITLFI